MSKQDTGRRTYHFYGRRKGHALKPSQADLVRTLLPEVRIDPEAAGRDPRSWFSTQPREIWLEIGFGGAEHLLWQARENPQAGLIGVEPFINGVAKALMGIAAGNLGNVRLYDDDVRDLLPALPAACLDRAFILFPDPWPKTRHKRRRIVSAALIEDLSRLMKPGAELRIASDIDDYVDWILRRLYAHPAFVWQAKTARDWRVRPDDWPQTRYEAKAGRAGRQSAYLSFRRI